MRRFFVTLVAAAAVLANASFLFADNVQYANWKAVADAMSVHIDKAYQLYTAGEPKAARDAVNVAYYQFYEKVGFERNVQARISGNRAGLVELQFSRCKKDINTGKSNAEVKASLQTLKDMLYEDAAELDPKGSSNNWAAFWSNFVASLLIILREGFEAILIVGAIIAYLIKSGNGDKLKPVYHGSILGVLASIVMAVILLSATGENSGKYQEIIEGVTMFIAVAVLFYVSNWMVSKSESEAWSNYIKGKVQSSIDGKSMISLAFTAFLSVFREGAEVILFYAALLTDAKSSGSMTAIWTGFAAGVVLLVFVYIAIRYLGVKLPLKPFFLATSILMFVMCVSFVGSGISEFVDADLFSPTIVNHIPTISVLGVYPYRESLIGQGIMILIIGASLAIGYAIQKKNLKKLEG